MYPCLREGSEVEHTLQYTFEWNPQKAQINSHKHKISFDQAATVFKDPNALSLFDEEHSQDEER
ncbi:MAG: BrnT family toxin [Cyanobacteria bacterium J06638_28]